MLKKCAILGLMLLLVGGLALAWVRSRVRQEQISASALAAEESLKPEEYVDRYSRWYELTPEQQNQLVLEIDQARQNKTAEQLAAEQEARLRRDLDRLAAGEANGGDIADFLYGAGWEDKVVEYVKQKEQEQIAQTASTVCLSIGTVLFGGCLLVWVFLSIAKGFKALAQRRKGRDTEDALDMELTDIVHEEDEEPTEAPSDFGAAPERGTDPGSPPSWLEADGEREHFVHHRFHDDVPSKRPTLAMEPCPTQEDGAVALLMSDEPAPEAEWSAQSQWAAQGSQGEAAVDTPQRQRFTPRPKVTILDPDQVAMEMEADNSLAEQADDLQKQIAEFKQVAQSVQEARQNQTAPINTTLKELAQQVSAIRDYAASQQDRVEKLQDGYDWTIIRTFCLRVIRCIDNMENRIARLTDANDSTAHLEEVKDELLFALESSGIEQFRPELHSEFRGQEKFAEAVKDKETAGEKDKAGTIAKVIRPGYRYIVDDDSYKVVRTAQVKLFG